MQLHRFVLRSRKDHKNDVIASGACVETESSDDMVESVTEPNHQFETEYPDVWSPQVASFCCLRLKGDASAHPIIHREMLTTHQVPQSKLSRLHTLELAAVVYHTKLGTVSFRWRNETLYCTRTLSKEGTNSIVWDDCGQNIEKIAQCTG